MWGSCGTWQQDINQLLEDVLGSFEVGDGTSVLLFPMNALLDKDLGSSQARVPRVIPEWCGWSVGVNYPTGGLLQCLWFCHDQVF